LQVETGENRPSVKSPYAMVNALGLSVDELLASGRPARERMRRGVFRAVAELGAA